MSVHERHERTMSLLSILQLELHIAPAALIILLMLPFSSNQKVRYYGCYIVYIFIVSFVSTILTPIFLMRPKNVRNNIISSRVLKHVSKLVGLKWQLRGGEILAEERGAVIVANHQSMFDILGMFDFWQVMDKCAPVAKKEVFYAWPFGLAAWASGVVFIDRKQGHAANRQLDEASRLIRNHKTKLWLFPEGTRNKKRDTLLPFKRGAFRVAIACQAPIIPLVYSPYYFLNSEKKMFGYGRVIVQVLDPIPTKGKTADDINQLMEDTREAMQKQYQLLGQEVLNNKSEANVLK